jgi:hypothetical protein
MTMIVRIVLSLVVGGLVVGCRTVPISIVDANLIVMSVHNSSAKPATLVVAAPGNVTTVVGISDPSVVAPGATVMVGFRVPPGRDWAIWANGGELMGIVDVKQHRGNLSMGIDIDEGGPSWWCKADCP